jgi:6-phosphofructokinase 1
MAALADAILMPEIPFDLAKVAARLQRDRRSGRAPDLVVVAEGARPASAEPSTGERVGGTEHMRRALSPGSSTEGTSAGRRVIQRSGRVSEAVALDLQRRCDCETFAFVLGQMIRGGRPTPTDRQLGLAYGAAAVRGLHEGQSGVMVAFQPPHLTYVPLADAVNTVRTVPPDSAFVQAARALGIALGD